MQRYEIEAYLGDALADLTTEQIDRLRAEADRIRERHPDPDDADLRDVALSAAVQYLLGEVDVDAAGIALRDAMLQVSRLRAGSRQLAVMLADDDETEAGAARRTGIDRMTLLKDRGKR